MKTKNKKITVEVNVNVVPDTEQTKELEVVIVLDSSGSMDLIKTFILGAYNEQLNSHKSNSKQSGIKTKATLVVFGKEGHVEPVIEYKSINIAEVPLLTPQTYLPYNATRLNDALGVALTESSKVDTPDRDVAFLVLIFSDGRENDSQVFSEDAVKELINARKGKGNWTFTYIGTNHDVKQVSNVLGVSQLNTRSFRATAAGTQKMSMDLSDATTNFYSKRSMGLKADENFYEGISDEDVPDELSPVTKRGIIGLTV